MKQTQQEEEYIDKEIPNLEEKKTEINKMMKDDLRKQQKLMKQSNNEMEELVHNNTNL